MRSSRRLNGRRSSRRLNRRGSSRRLHRRRSSRRLHRRRPVEVVVVIPEGVGEVAGQAVLGGRHQRGHPEQQQHQGLDGQRRAHHPGQQPQGGLRGVGGPTIVGRSRLPYWFCTVKYQISVAIVRKAYLTRDCAAD